MNDTDDYIARYAAHNRSYTNNSNSNSMNDDNSNLNYDDHGSVDNYESYQELVNESGYSNPPTTSGVQQKDSLYLSHEDEDEDEDDEVDGSESNMLNPEDTLMDLAKLEKLQEEAERIKTIGNKHMAEQEYMQAYNCYSAALQISPVGPSSHVFLANRAAALLSLKKYASAATDARRAIALAPSFGKAYARLGQALYFLKDYIGAVEAYEDALRYEPNNDCTVTYLEKAKAKVLKQKVKKARKSSGSASAMEEASNGSTMAETTTQYSAHRSIATDTHNKHNIVQKHTYAGHDVAINNTALQKAVADVPSGVGGGRTLKSNEQQKQQLQHLLPSSQHAPRIGVPSSTVSVAASAITFESGERQQDQNNTNANDKFPQINGITNNEGISTVAIDDPEFDEALRIQQRANKFLVQKQYRAAIEEFTAALFLVPDDPLLSPELHLGRAHALNGSRRHESARNDAKLAVKLNPTPAAYSTLAKSLFYMKDYSASVDAFEKCIQLLPPGESLGLFDRAYLEKAEKALAEEESEGKLIITKQQPTVPKLPPPRFVPREEAIQSQPPALRPMPKKWPQQQVSARKLLPLKCGTEREIVFLSESLGVKLNRGSDGIVRVLSVTPTTGGSVVVRQGDIQPGDVVREAAGVDVRRPITNIMWGDTVALIKMAPRPITFLVAQELSPVPPDVLLDTKNQLEQQRQQDKSNAKRNMTRPSNSSGDEAVSSLIASESLHDGSDVSENGGEDEIMEVKEFITYDIIEVENGCDFLQANTDTMLQPSIFKQCKTISNPYPSNINSDEPVKDLAQTSSTESNTTSNNEIVEVSDRFDDDIMEVKDGITYDIVEVDNTYDGTHQRIAIDRDDDHLITTSTTNVNPVQSQTENLAEQPEHSNSTYVGESHTSISNLDDSTLHPSNELVVGRNEMISREHLNNILVSTDGDGVDEGDIVELEDSTAQSQSTVPAIVGNTTDERLKDEEERILGGEILFLTGNPVQYGEWDTFKWMCYSGRRSVSSCQEVHRQHDGEKKRSLLPVFWKTGGKRYEPRALAIYDEPRLIMLLRRPSSVEEVYQLLGLPDIAHDPETSIDKYWVLESAIDPAFAKLRLSSLTTITSLPEENADERDKSCFQLFTPFETIRLSAVHIRGNNHEQSFRDSGAYLETLAVEASLCKMIYASHSRANERNSSSNSDMAWMHQIVTGSLHSIVVSGNVKALTDSLEFVRKAVVGISDTSPNLNHVPSRIIDVLDEAGFTPLYYACKNKMHVAAQHLVQAGANAWIKLEPGKGTLLHIAARNLDDKMISILLSVQSDLVDVNAIDNEYRTPVYVAATEGSVLDNGRDPLALCRCMTALQRRGGRSAIYGAAKINRHPVSILSSMLLPEYLSAALDAFPFRYPLSAIDARILHPRGLSLSALYHYPIHFAILAMRKDLSKQSKEDEFLPECRTVRCLRVLLERGFEPNERLECVDASKTGSEDLQPFYGFAPIQLLAFVALELESQKGKVDAASLEKKSILIWDVADFLLRNGARLSVEPPPRRRLRKKTGESGPSPSIDILPIKIESDKHVMNLLGGDKRLKKANENWVHSKKVEMPQSIDLLDNNTILDDMDTPGGNDSLSCAICWVEFGKIMNRRHKCRVTGRFVCDDCSCKRLVIGSSEHRISDGQYLLAKVESCRTARGKNVTSNVSSTTGTLGSTKTVLERLETEERANRESLFGGFVDKAANYIMGEDEDISTSSKVKGLTNTLDQTRDALNQRGDRLASLSDKSAQLVDASADFAKMAKELNKQNDRGFFGW